MATGTTLTVVTRRDKDYQQSVTLSDAGSPAFGSPTFVYDDAEDQESLILALDKLRAYVTHNVAKRKAAEV